MTTHRWALVLLVAGIVSGCGGGGGAQNHAPTASAGPAQTVNKGSTVTLDASGSSDPDGDSLAYKWQQVSGPAVTLTSPSSAHPTFTAPSQSGALVFSLVVNDGKVDSAAMTVTVSVQDRPPVANAGTAMTVGVGATVMLVGTGSSDPDSDPLTYSWTQVSGPTVQITAANTSRASFTAPGTNATLGFQLQVSDGESSATQTVTITVDAHASNAPPVANAGANQTLPKGSFVGLLGTGMDPERQPITYKWAEVSGPPVTLQQPDSDYTYFTASTTPAVYVFSLTVNDGVQDSAPSLVTITIQNFPPVMTSLTLSPTAPKTNDPITATAAVFDNDGDPIALSYSWKRNGVVLPGRTTQTLAPTDTTKGDVISVTVTASDGTTQVSQDATTTILDTQAVLTAANAPRSVNYADSVSFQLTGSDADGDSITGFELAYGPAGMSVNSSGLVTWHAVGPMFDRDSDFNWGVRLHNQPLSLVSGTIMVADQNRKYPLRRTGLDMPIARSGVVVTDLDGDGVADALILGYGAVYEMQYIGAKYAQTWVYPFGGSPTGLGDYTFGAVTAADVDGDHHAEIYFSDSHVLVMLDGTNRREAHRLDLGNETCASLAVVDLDNDGTPDLVCLAISDATYSSQHLLVLRATDLSLEWELKGVDLGTSMAIGNVDHDPALEIVTSNGYVYDGATHQNEWAYGGGFGAPVAVGDLDGSGVGSIIGNAAGIGTTTVGVNIYSAVTKTLKWSISGPSVAALVATDLDRDNKAEIVIGGHNWDGVSAYSYDAGSGTFTQLWSLSQRAVISDGNDISSMAVGDIDGDGSPEVVWGAGIGDSSANLLLVSGTTPPVGFKYYPAGSLQLAPVFAGGYLTRSGGGRERLMFHVPGYSVNGGNVLVGLDPVTGSLDLSASLGGPGQYNPSALTVADFDGDGVDDVCVATSSYLGGFYADYDFATTTLKWSTLPAQSMGVALTHADVTGSGTPNLVGITNNGYVSVYDVHAQTLLWQSTQLPSGGIDVEAADVDGDGKVEIVALGMSHVTLFSRDSTPSGYTQRFTTQLAGDPAFPAGWPNNGLDLLVADTDGDGQAEIYVLTAPTLQTASIQVYDNQLRLQRTIPLNVYATSLSLEGSAFRRKNLVVSVSGSNGIQTVADKSSLWVIDPVAGTLVWKSPSFMGDVAINSVTFPDLNADGVPEIVMGTNSGMYVTQ